MGAAQTRAQESIDTSDRLPRRSQEPHRLLTGYEYSVHAIRSAALERTCSTLMSVYF